MATNIGRVEFLVGLDGRKLSAEARAMAKQIGEEGDLAGDEFAKNFQASSEKRMSRVGKRLADKLADDGRLGGSRFSKDFENEVTSNFRRMQANLASILSDKDAFASYAGAFDDVDSAVKQVETDLQKLRDTTFQVKDANGETRDVLVLTKKEFDAFGAEARRLGAELDKQNDQQRRYQEVLKTNADRLNEYGSAQRELGAEFERFHAQQERMTASIEKSSLATEKRHKLLDLEVDAWDRTAAAIDRHATSVSKAEKSNNVFERSLDALGAKVANSWARTDSTVRLVLALIASAADQVAVLGSAAGAGLIAIGPLAASAVGGIGAVAVSIGRLNADLEELPPNLRAAATELKDLKGAFGEARDVITSGFVVSATGSFERLGKTLGALAPELRNFGRAGGDVFDDFTKAIEPGSEGLEEIGELLDNAARLFKPLSAAVGTWGGALVRAFNGAIPLAEDFVGWVQRLGDSFDQFTRGPGLDEWVGNAQRVFGSLGGLLDSLGTALNNLATPEAVDRTVKFIDNISDFVPVLGDLLNVVGTLDPLGLLAEWLNELGQAVEPLIPALTILADGLNTVLSAINGGLIAAIVGLAGAFKLLQATDALVSFANGASAMEGALGGLGPTAGKAATGISKVTGALGKAGVWGAVAAGIYGVVQGIVDLSREIAGVDDQVRNLVGSNASLDASFKALNDSGTSAEMSAVSYSDALDRIASTQNQSWTGARNLTLAWDAQGNQALALIGTLSELDAGIKGLPLDDQVSKFSSWATEIGASDAQISAMLNEMPDFKQSLIDSANAAGQGATDQDLLSAAMGRTTAASQQTSTDLQTIGTQAKLSKDQVDALASAISGFGSKQLDTRAASRDFQQSILDLTASLTENGAVVGDGTGKSLANEAAIDDLIKSTLDYSGAIVTSTGDQEKANAVLASGKDQLIAMLTQFDAAGLAAGEYTEYLDSIPDDVDTIVEADTANAKSKIDELTKPRVVTITPFIAASSGRFPDAMNRATGGAIYGPGTGTSDTAGLFRLSNGEHVLTAKDVKAMGGQDGVYAFRRALQGGSAPVAPTGPGRATGGAVDGYSGSGVYIAPGAIVVQGGADPRRTANEVVMRIFERLN